MLGSCCRDNIPRMAMFVPPPPPPPVSIEEVTNLTEIELRLRVNEWFAYLRVCTNEQRAGIVAQAEFYMRELERRENAKIAARDLEMAQQDRITSAKTALRDLEMAERSHRLEIAVIVLIGAELLLAFVALIYTYIESSKQQNVLDAMNKSTGETATAMKGAGGYLQTLSTDQKTANDNIQANLKQTSAMATALKQQLNILKQQQAQRMVELSKKPEMELYAVAGAAMVNLNATPPVPVPIRSETDTSQTFDLRLRNGGTATALNGVLRAVIFATDVQLQGANFQLLADEANTQGRVYTLNFDRLRPGINTPAAITITFPKGRQPFTVLFNVDDDESDSGTILGALNIAPRK
jgi:hypothetical protein